jgi:hypothetical protein
MSLEGKLQIKPGQRIALVNAPSHFSIDLETEGSDSEGVLIFVRDRGELAKHGSAALESARQDHLTWIAYPKGGQLGTDLNRDILWNLLRGKGVKPVRQIAIDDTWSALRFRPA